MADGGQDESSHMGAEDGGGGDEQEANGKGSAGSPSSCVGCSSLTNGGLSVASKMAFGYFGLNGSGLSAVNICLACQKEVEEFAKKCKEEIVKGVLGREMLNLEAGENGATPGTKKPFGVDINMEDDSFDENLTVAELTERVMKKYKVQDQVTNYVRASTQRVNELTDQLKQMNVTLDKVEDNLYSSYLAYTKIFQNQPTPKVLIEVDIGEDGTARSRTLTDDSNIFINSESLLKLPELLSQARERKKAKAAKLCSAPKPQKAGTSSQGSRPAKKRKPGPASKTGYYEASAAAARSKEECDSEVELLNEEFQSMESRSVQGYIPRKPPKKGSTYYGMYRNLLSFWLQVEVLEVVWNDATDQWEYIVAFENTQDDLPTGDDESDVDVMPKCVQLTLKQMAYHVPCLFELPVGMRVIAKWKDQFSANPSGQHDKYFVGIVADLPKASSNYRYFVFFDDGSAQYVYPNEVLIVCQSSKDVWNDVHPNMYDFIKDYINRWPDWPLVKLQVGARVSTEWNGMWMISEILEIYDKLARVRFENDGREEWIYRGSSRFRPVYKFDKMEVNEGPIVPNKNAEKLKSTSGDIDYYAELLMFTDTSAKAADILQLPNLCIENQGYTKKIGIPSDAPKPKQLVEHYCDSFCVIKYVPSDAHKRVSPFAIPLYFGWVREQSQPRHTVHYTAPCGVRLRNYSELEQYLELTECDISIDHFTFDQHVNCLDKFVPVRPLLAIDDLSDGKEKVPVHCVNSADSSGPPDMDYIVSHVLDPKLIHDITDENFLVCCDCTDNCLDQSKCACWQLTYEGVSFKTKDEDEDAIPVEAYEQRRLMDQVTSGIYECNTRCKCRKTCSNRVVQNGLQWPVEIFKTAKKGWGIRALHDMPRGTFVGVYMGEIMDSRTAERRGRKTGDEYFADIDFPEIITSYKSDYESEVTDIEKNSSDENDDGAIRVKRKWKAKRRKRALYSDSEDSDDGSSSRNRRRSARKILFGENEPIYTVDAKFKGNFARYLNHSCNPNLFAQTVFVNSHDIRFPWVAFFTDAFIRAGSELTWFYGYNWKSLKRKEPMYCQCMTPYCKGRLL